LRKMEELTKQMASLRETLKPTYERIDKCLQELSIAKDILFVIDFEGKTSYKTQVVWDDVKMDVRFSFPKVS